MARISSRSKSGISALANLYTTLRTAHNLCARTRFFVLSLFSLDFLAGVIASRMRTDGSLTAFAAIAGVEPSVLTFASGLHTGFRFVLARHNFATEATSDERIE
jgi:hypothetical protein